MIVLSAVGFIYSLFLLPYIKYAGIVYIRFGKLSGFIDWLFTQFARSHTRSVPFRAPELLLQLANTKLQYLNFRVINFYFYCVFGLDINTYVASLGILCSSFDRLLVNRAAIGAGSS